MSSELENTIESSPQLVIQQIKEWIEIVIDFDFFEDNQANNG